MRERELDRRVRKRDTVDGLASNEEDKGLHENERRNTGRTAHTPASLPSPTMRTPVEVPGPLRMHPWKSPPSVPLQDRYRGHISVGLSPDRLGSLALATKTAESGRKFPRE